MVRMEEWLRRKKGDVDADEGEDDIVWARLIASERPGSEGVSYPLVVGYFCHALSFQFPSPYIMRGGEFGVTLVLLLFGNCYHGHLTYNLFFLYWDT